MNGPVDSKESRAAGRGIRHLDSSVASAIRRRREEVGITLRALAERIGVSASLISQVENGKVTPSVGTLYAIVNELGISLDELFLNDGGRTGATTPTAADEAADEAAENGAPPASPAPRAEVTRAATSATAATLDEAVTPPAGGGAAKFIVRRAERPEITLAAGVHWQRLTAAPNPFVDFLHVTYEVGGESCPANALMRHAGHEYGLVLQGRLGATVGFESFELEAGDSISFPSSVPHRFWTIGDEPSVVVWTIIGRHGDPSPETVGTHP